MDLGADLLIDGEDSSGELAFRVVDKLGGLVALDVKTAPLPFGEVLGRGTGENLAHLLEELPVSILVDVPRREIGKLPLLIRPDGVTGGIEATLEMRGNALDPTVQLSVQSHALALSAVPHTPIDGVVTAAYDGSVGMVQIDLHSPTDLLLKGLDQVTGMNVTTKIDTSDSANPRPEVEMQVAKDISLELAFVLGTPPPGTNPDTSYATINWRFVRNWSLETTFGDYGSTFADMVWKYRY
jgi:hypothetical protein